VACFSLALCGVRVLHRTRITEIDFLDSLMLLSFPQELSEKLKEVGSQSVVSLLFGVLVAVVGRH
jgi:hypothetical protein